MTHNVDWFVRQSCFMAGLAYASRMKRVGHSYYVGVVAATFNASRGSEVVFGGSMPRPLPLAQDERARGGVAKSRATLVPSRRQASSTALDSE
jgi:hypothetical protein